MHPTRRILLLHSAALISGAIVLASAGTSARTSPPGSLAPMLYAIRGARVVTVSGTPIERGTVLMRNGIIEDVGATVTIPADAGVIDGTGLTVYPGLIDMANTTAVEAPPASGAAATGRAGGGGGGGGGGTQATMSLEDTERAKRVSILHADFEAARHVRLDGPEMQRLAAAGVTSVLAVPSLGAIRGQSALVNVLAKPDDAQIGNIGEYRGGLTVLRSPVALHVAFSGLGAGGGYPASLLGYIAFVRQSFYDAQYQRDARAFAERHKDTQRPSFEPVLDAMVPALERKLPVAFDVDEEREIYRALTIAKEFNLDVIISGGAGAAAVADDLKAASAKVIYSVNFQTGGGGGGGRGGAGAGGDTLRAVRARVAAPRVPAALDKAGVPFAFTANGATPADFIRNVARVVKEGGLSADAALRALTVNAAKMAGAGDRLGTIEKGRIANLIVTDGDLFENGRVRHVFIDGWPIDMETPAAPATTGRGRGGR